MAFGESTDPSEYQLCAPSAELLLHSMRTVTCSEAVPASGACSAKKRCRGDCGAEAAAFAISNTAKGPIRRSSMMRRTGGSNTAGARIVTLLRDSVTLPLLGTKTALL